MQHLINRFISYVTIDSQSDSNSETTPSTAKQWNIANKLVEDLKAIGLSDITMDDKPKFRNRKKSATLDF